MNKIIDYKIVSNESTLELSKNVNKFITEGWQPLGGICHRHLTSAYGTKHTELLQAMIFTEK